jgi:hypothetical protein
MKCLENIERETIALWAVLLNAVVQPSYPAAIVFCAVCATFAFNAYISNREYTESNEKLKDTILEKIHKLDMAVEGINGDLSEVIKSHSEIAKMAEETKKLLSQTNLAQSFLPKKRL